MLLRRPLLPRQMNMAKQARLAYLLCAWKGEGKMLDASYVVGMSLLRSSLWGGGGAERKSKGGCHPVVSSFVDASTSWPGAGKSEPAIRLGSDLQRGRAVGSWIQHLHGREPLSELVLGKAHLSN